MIATYAAALLPLALGTLGAGSKALNTSFETIQPSFKDIITTNSKIELMAENKTYPIAHEAPVYIPSTGELFVVGNWQTPTGGKPIEVSRIVPRKNGTYVREHIHPDIPNANGAINYKGGILYCAQGTIERKSALIWMNTTAPYETKVILDNYYGKRFNSLNDLDIASDGAIWFTDPTYGYDQGFTPEPEMPNQVYRYDPETGDVRVVADGIGQPNGIAFSPDQKILYVSDTSASYGDRKPATVYAFDVVTYSDAPFLTNRRVFAYVANGIPDGVKVDTDGNVYTGCGDGVQVFSPGGVLIGKVLLPDTSSNLCFGEPGEMFAMNEHRLFKVTLDRSVRGTILDF
ncbi:hypothetical protein BDV18DRAFT_62132 [Aspergillus unguis]